MITRPDFERIAFAIKQARQNVSGEIMLPEEAIDTVVEFLSDEFCRLNPRFSVEKFRSACGSPALEETERK